MYHPYQEVVFPGAPNHIERATVGHAIERECDERIRILCHQLVAYRAGGLAAPKMFASKKYELPIVDRVGGGDAFAAGIIYGALNKLGGQRTIDFAAASGALQQMIEGDFNRVSVAEVERLAGGDSSGRVLR